MGRVITNGIISNTATVQTMSAGSTANRPTLAASQAGTTYYNTDVNQMEVWSGTYWHVLGEYPNVTITTNTAATSNHSYWVNTTSGAVSLTLPASPRQGDFIKITDVAGTFNTNNCTVLRNGNPIMRIADDMTISTQGASIRMVFYDATRGWLIESI